MLKVISISALAFIALVSGAEAGYKCDQSGNCYYFNDYGSTKRIQGFNSSTGSSWNTTIQPNGNMTGVDSNGDPWYYNSQGKTYYNYGTGKTCYGSGIYRRCY